MKQKIFSFFLTCFVLTRINAFVVNDSISYPIEPYKLNLNYVQSLSSKFDFYYSIGNTNKAIEILKERQLILESITGCNSLEFANAFADLGMSYLKCGITKKALECNKRALSFFEKPTRNTTYRNLTAIMSDYYLKNGEYDEAERLIKLCLTTFDGDHTNPSYYGHLSNLANCYYYKGDYNASITILKDLLIYEEQNGGVNSIRYASILKSLVLDYSRVNKIRDALDAQEQSLKIYENNYGKESIEYAASLSLSGHLFFLMGNREKAFSILENAANIIRNLMGTVNVQYFNSLRSLLFACDDDNKKLDLLEEIKSILFQLKFDLGTSFYVSAMCDLAIGYSELGRVNEVLEIEDSIKVDFDISNYFANNKTKYANYLNSIATCKFSMGNYQESIKLGLRALDIYRKEYGLDAGKYENTILNLMSCYGNLKDTANLFSIIKNTNILECIKKELSPNMHLLSSNNRNKYWNVFSPIFCDMLPLLAVLSNDSAFVCDAYDMSALFSKGLLLKTEIELLDFIKKHGDSTLQIEYTNLLSSYEKLAKTNDITETDSIKAVINRQEDKIRQNMYERGRVIDTKVSWKDIQERLGAKDVAIEFLTSNTDTFQLNSALLLRKGYRYPKMIPLCNMKQLEKSLSQWQNDSLYTLLWQPIENEIDNVENIYFSPAGALNNLPMEYLLCPDGQYMCEKYGMYRLSSTQELLKKKSNAKIKKAVLFGGLDYDLDITNGHSLSLKESKFTQQERELRESFLSRSGFDPLLNTLLEITEVSNLLEGNKVQCAIFKGNEGVENSLKKLSGSSIDIIHISTHGMYIEANETTKMKQKNNFDFIRTNNISSVAIEDAALSRSFLVMSGGNMLTRHKLIPEGIDDGILTSLEISHLDLFGTNLVVLSACQTGLGDVTSEGVYGLQRGFKKAGAKTILMSLDKVDDEATRILMVEFYKNLMSGKTKHQSLRDAQKYLRQVENGKYNDPKYWASFIMLDGLN